MLKLKYLILLAGLVATTANAASFAVIDSGETFGYVVEGLYGSAEMTGGKGVPVLVTNTAVTELRKGSKETRTIELAQRAGLVFHACEANTKVFRLDASKLVKGVVLVSEIKYDAKGKATNQAGLSATVKEMAKFCEETNK